MPSPTTQGRLLLLTTSTVTNEKGGGRKTGSEGREVGENMLVVLRGDDWRGSKGREGGERNEGERGQKGISADGVQGWSWGIWAK